MTLRKILRSRAFKLGVIALLVLVALRLKGEPLTIGALGARVADLLVDLGAEGAVRKD